MAFLTFSCISTQKGLKEYEYFLYKQKISGNKKTSSYALEETYRQKTNRKILETPLMPYLWIYNLYGDKDYSDKAEKRREKARKKYQRKLEKRPEDSIKISEKYQNKLDKIETFEKEGPFLKREVGEAPTVFDYNLAKETRDQMHLYLFKHGYFENEVTLKVDTFDNRNIVKTSYEIKENKGTHVRRIKYHSDDSLINSYIKPLHPEFESVLDTGMLYNEEMIEKEINNLELFYKNQGFFAFRKQ